MQIRELMMSYTVETHFDITVKLILKHQAESHKKRNRSSYLYVDNCHRKQVARCIKTKEQIALQLCYLIRIIICNIRLELTCLYSTHSVFKGH